MKLSDHLRMAQDELINAGQAVTNSDVFEHAMTNPDAVDAFEAEAMDKARAHALRTISSNLSAAVNPTTDPETLSLFDVAAYRPPACVSIPGPDGEVRHKGILHAEEDDLLAHESVLAGNISAAQVKFFDFRQFRLFVQPYLDGGNVRVALERAGRRDAA